MNLRKKFLVRLSTASVVLALSLEGGKAEIKYYTSDGLAVARACGIPTSNNIDADTYDPSGLYICAAQAAEDHRTLVASFELEKPTIAVSNCKSDTWKTARVYEPAILALGSKTARAAQVASAIVRAAATLDDGRRIINELSSATKRFIASAADMDLWLGDTALKLGCVDIADAQYRNVLQIFGQDYMASYRQRAQIGVDDVRAKKGSLLCRTIGYC